MRIAAAALMAYPLIILVDVRSIRMPGLVSEILGSAATIPLCRARALVCSVPVLALIVV